MTMLRTGKSRCGCLLDSFDDSSFAETMTSLPGSISPPKRRRGFNLILILPCLLIVTDAIVEQIKLHLLASSYIRDDRAVSGLPWSTEVTRDTGTSIIITSNLIPSHPSIGMINETISSLHFLHGLSPAAPLIITVDGLKATATIDDHKRLRQYVESLQQTFHQSHITIVASPNFLHLAGNVFKAMDMVTTEFVYVLQHDQPFIREVNHTGLIKSMQEYPDYLRIVRFPLRNIKRINTDKRNGECFGQNTPVDHVNGLNFTKTPAWSDNNHLTRKTYYEEMKQFFHTTTLPMEWVMLILANANCSWWGPFYYGKKGEEPYVKHLNGRRTQNYTRNGLQYQAVGEA